MKLVTTLKEEEDLKKLDPIVLPCVQLLTYVLNDQPTLTKKLVESNYIFEVMKTFETRIPL
jgi:hypothetical protein